MRKNQNIGETELLEIEAQFKKSCSLIRTIFGINAFKVYFLDDITKRGYYSATKVNQGLYFILMYWFTIYEKNQVVPYSDLIREEMINLQVHNDDFLDTLTGSGTNSKTKIIKKFEIFGKTLKEILGYPKDEPRCFSNNLKQSLWDNNPECKLCNQKIIDISDAEVDHIICYWQGGKTIPENARLVHRYCNKHRDINHREIR